MRQRSGTTSVWSGRGRGLCGLLLIGMLGLPPCVVAAVDTAREQVERGDFDAARGSLEEHLRGQPDDPAARHLLAQILAWQGEHRAAREIYRDLRALEPDNADYLLGEAQTLLWEGRPAEALPLLRRGRQLAPDYEALWQTEWQARQALGQDHDPAGRDALLSDASQRFPDAAWLPVAEQRTLEMELGGRHEWLDSGFDNRHGARLDVVSTRAGHATYYGALLHENRFRRDDQGIEAGVSLPLDRGWNIHGEIGASPSPDFLPRWYAEAGGQRRFATGTGLRAGYRHIRYPGSNVHRLVIGADQYWSAWRAALDVTVTQVESVGTAPGAAASLTRYYGDRSFAGLRVAAGREEESLPDAVLRNQVRSAGLFGRHWFAPRWAVSWDVAYHQQGSLYDSYGLRLGLRHAF